MGQCLQDVPCSGAVNPLERGDRSQRSQDLGTAHRALWCGWVEQGARNGTAASTLRAQEGAVGPWSIVRCQVGPEGFESLGVGGLGRSAIGQVGDVPDQGVAAVAGGDDRAAVREVGDRVGAVGCVLEAPERLGGGDVPDPQPGSSALWRISPLTEASIRHRGRMPARMRNRCARARLATSLPEASSDRIRIGSIKRSPGLRCPGVCGATHPIATSRPSGENAAVPLAQWTRDGPAQLVTVVASQVRTPSRSRVRTPAAVGGIGGGGGGTRQGDETAGLRSQTWLLAVAAWPSGEKTTSKYLGSTLRPSGDEVGRKLRPPPADLESDAALLPPGHIPEHRVRPSAVSRTRASGRPGEMARSRVRCGCARTAPSDRPSAGSQWSSRSVGVAAGKDSPIGRGDDHRMDAMMPDAADARPCDSTSRPVATSQIRATSRRPRRRALAIGREGRAR